MDSKTYWRLREEEALKHYITDEKEYSKQIQQIYSDMLASINEQINGFYGRYAAKEGITLAEAKKRVSKLEIADYERKAKKYVKEKDFSKQANDEMRLYNATMKINRLEMLKANIGLEMIAGHNELEKFMAGILKGRTEDELKRQAGILGKTILNNAKKADAIVNGSFKAAKVGSKSTFSDRIWQYQDMMREDLGKLLQTGLIQGKNARALTSDLRKYLLGDKVGKGATYNVERLMRTELARVQTEAQKESFKRNGFTEYMFIANASCCDDCQILNGKTFKLEKMMPGDNAPPVHPHCRCSVAAYEDSEEYEAWLDYLDSGKTTAEWNKSGRAAWEKSQKALENFSKNSKIKETKFANTKRRGLYPPPMDETRYNKMVEGLNAHGVKIMQAEGDVARWLEWMNAEASIGGDSFIYHMEKVPSASAFFEEIIHITQAKKYGIMDYDRKELYIREVLANRKLLRNSKAYGFTVEDVEDIERNVEIWETLFEKFTGVKFDESGIDREI